ncbi:MAG: hypothetical protein ACKOEC_14735, partial [Acidimicrobiia bacterium]
MDKAVYLSGELVVVDAVNRRGALRLDGDGPMHYFAMLPYGLIGYHGASAELRDVPLGTHLHGFFHPAPAGDEETIPLVHRSKHPQFALSLEDDFTHYHRRGQAWKVESVDLKKGKLNVVPEGKLVKHGIASKYTFDLDSTSKIWKDRRLSEWD